MKGGGGGVNWSVRVHRTPDTAKGSEGRKGMGRSSDTSTTGNAVPEPLFKVMLLLRDWETYCLWMVLRSVTYSTDSHC